MTRRDALTCVHEPFGDAFYYGPERLSTRFEDDEKARRESGFEKSTYKTIFDRLESESKEVRIFSYVLLFIHRPLIIIASCLLPMFSDFSVVSSFLDAPVL